MKLLVLISLCADVFVQYLLRTLSSTNNVNLHALYLATCALFAIFILQYYKKTLENTEGAIKNGQSRETGKIGYTDEEKQSKNTTQ